MGELKGDASDAMRLAIAYHQAGFVVAAMCLGIPFESVSLDDGSIMGDGRMSGLVDFGDLAKTLGEHRDSIRKMRSMLVMNRAGVLSEERSPVGKLTDPSALNNEWFFKMVFAMYPETGKRHAADLNRQARRIVEKHRKSIAHVVEGLMTKGTMSAAEVRKIMEAESLG